MIDRGLRALLPIAYLFLVTACGGGGGSGAPAPQPGPPAPPPPPPPPPPSSVNLSSDPGDYIGGGQNYTYTQADTRITVTAQDALLTITIEGDQSWRGEFQLPDTFSRIEAGTYNNLTRYPFHDAAVGGLSWSGEGRGCNTLNGSLIINEVVYDGATLTLIDLEFSQYCEGGAAALNGDIFWDAADPTMPPGPVSPPPAGLWEPAPGTTPDNGNFVYLESQPGDYIGAGSSYLYTGATAAITVNAANGRVSVSIDGNEMWNGDFRVMESIDFVEVGYYGDLQRYPFHNPVKGGLSWSGEGRGCNTLTGWFVVDSITYDGDTLTAVELRFEQHCEGAGPALYGAIRWDANDPTSAPGPVVPPPAGLWSPAAGATPDTGNFVYLESEPGDYIGNGSTYLYTQADSRITVNAFEANLGLYLEGDTIWSGDFQGMSSLSRLEVGYYGDLQRYPFHNPVKGGLSWSGDGRGCNTLSGWFVVDSVTYDGANLAAIELRFEQHCEGNGPALYGAIRWDANDPTAPPGPVVPPPDGLWEPAPGTTPATGSYLYMESEVGDYIGQGRSYLYTQADSLFRMIPTEFGAIFAIDGDENWSGGFRPMYSLSRLEVGYYGDVNPNNPAKGAFDWGGEGRGCNRMTGWFVVDSVTYDGDALTAIELRFEQHCEGLGPALYGAIRWDANDPTTPPGPVVPPPMGLWEPAPGTTPDTGNYVYLESEPGDYIGAGREYLYTSADSQITAEMVGDWLNVAVFGDENWGGNFQPMYTLAQLEVGYYGDLQRYPFHNPAKGGLSWGGEGRGCNRLDGWFVVDSVTYDGNTLTAIELRFEQHCEGVGPALYGEIHWSADDTTSAPGPVVPPPDGLWEPAPGTTPASGNFVYLESEPGDYIGQGLDYLYTPADTQFSIIGTDMHLSVDLIGAESWNGQFEGMSSISQLEVGYYGGLERYPFHNPAKGGLSWSGEGRGCNTLTGWFVVDSVTYNGDTLTAIELRFEQHCEDNAPALNGAIRWSQ